MTKKELLLTCWLAIASTSPLYALELPPQYPPPQDASAETAVLPAQESTSVGATAGSTESVAPDEGPEALVAGPMPLAPAPESLWKRVRNGFAMPEVDSPLVARHEAWYLNHPEYFQRMIERSRLYLYFIVEEVEKRRMPMEVALLPMIESAFNPTAYSRAHAAGIWQFIPSTGKRYGLQQTWWYDGRRDVLAATRAALDYLQQLHLQFGDWHLALAAYNWGENGVARAVARNRVARKPTTYMNLRMPRETRNYLPKLQAVKNIIANPRGLAFPLEDIPNQPYFTTVTTPRHIDMQVAAQLAEIPLDEFKSLNPGHTRPVITSNGTQTLLVPIDKAGIFNVNLEQYDQPLVSWQTYTLKKGEVLDRVAARFGITEARLREINGINRHLTPSPGRTLLVPMSGDEEASNLADTWDNPEFLAPKDYYMNRMAYRVRNGDSLYSIARKNRVTVAALKEWNRLRGNGIRAGQRLIVYGNARGAMR